jgi:hypothetical protein
MFTFSADQSKDTTAGKVHTPADNDRDTEWTGFGSGRIGANVKAGDVGGKFEWGVSETAPTLRQFFGTWNFGAGQLLVGQSYTPVFGNLTNMVYGDNSAVSYGGVYEGRQPMIQVSFGGFKFALVRPSTTLGTGVTPVAFAGAGSEVDTTLPKIEAAYTFKTDMFSAKVMGGYNSFEIDTDTKDYDVDSWVVGFTGKVNLGPAYIGLDVYQAQNGGNFAMTTVGDDVANLVGAKIKDVDTLAGILSAGVKVSDMLAFEGGYGNVSCESDIATEKDDDASFYFVQATIGLAPGVSITPEIGKIDLKKDNANDKQGDTTYFGARWQINF